MKGKALKHERSISKSLVRQLLEESEPRKREGEHGLSPGEYLQRRISEKGLHRACRSGARINYNISVESTTSGSNAPTLGYQAGFFPAILRKR